MTLRVLSLLRPDTSALVTGTLSVILSRSNEMTKSCNSQPANSWVSMATTFPTPWVG